ncbi:MAG: hypothetical protein ACFFG0_03610 [Candidatus Thorarchaeota archaeon]
MKTLIILLLMTGVCWGAIETDNISFEIITPKKEKCNEEHILNEKIKLVVCDKCNYMFEKDNYHNCKFIEMMSEIDLYIKYDCDNCGISITFQLDYVGKIKKGGE